MSQQSKRWVSFPILFLVLACAGSLSAFWLEMQKTDRLVREIDSLRSLTNELDRLRAENMDAVHLRSEHQEIEQLRRDNQELYRLRNEVHQLREEKAALVKAGAAKTAATARDATITSPALPNSAHPAMPSAGTSPLPTPSPVAAEKKAPKPWLGFYYVDISPGLKTALSLSDEQTGVVISYVEPDSPAEKADMQVNDLVISCDGQPVKTTESLAPLYGKLAIGQTVTLDALRSGSFVRLSLQAVEKPESEPPPQTH